MYCDDQFLSLYPVSCLYCFETIQDTSTKVQELALERLKNLEEDLAKSRLAILFCI